MNEVTLFGKYTFPTWNVEKNGAELARLSSALFLFDRVIVVDHASVPGLDTVLRRRMEEVKRAKDIDIEAIIDSGLVPPSPNNSTEELMRAGVGITELQRRASRRLYAPLINAGIVQIHAKDRVLKFDTACVGYTASIPHWRDAAYDIIGRHGIEYFVPPIASGSMYSAYHALLEYIRDLGVEEAAQKMLAVGSRDPNQQLLAFIESMLFDFFHSSFAVPRRRTPIVFQHDPHVEMYEAVLRGISAHALKDYGQPLRRDEPESNAALSVRLLGQTLMELPMLVPRAPEAILEIREIFDEERHAFSEHIDRLSEDLSAEGPKGDKEIVLAARQHLVRPFRDLERKLAKPGRRLAKNLLSSPGLVGASIAFTAGVASGGRYGALLAAFGSILSSAVSTQLQESDTIEASNVSFLLRVQRHASRRRSG